MYVTDNLGSVVAVIDSSGHAALTNPYTPYGLDAQTGSLDPMFTYTGAPCPLHPARQHPADRLSRQRRPVRLRSRQPRQLHRPGGDVELGRLRRSCTRRRHHRRGWRLRDRPRYIHMDWTRRFARLRHWRRRGRSRRAGNGCHGVCMVTD